MDCFASLAMTAKGGVISMKQPAVYIMASRRHGTLYIGVTSNLLQRVYQHREALISGFTERYGYKLPFGRSSMTRWNPQSRAKSS